MVRVLASGFHRCFLVRRWGTRLLASDEPGFDPYCLRLSQIDRETKASPPARGNSFPLTPAATAGVGIVGMLPVRPPPEVDGDLESLGGMLRITDHLMSGENVSLVA